MDGTHSVERSAEVTERVLAATFKALADHHILFEGMVLKPNMARPGESSGAPFDPESIAAATVRALQRTVPVAVPGIFFLSGGMSEEEATLALNAMNKLEAKKPWHLAFSYGRALQHSVLRAWNGNAENKAAAQETLLRLARNNSEAVRGVYGGSGASGESLHEANYAY